MIKILSKNQIRSADEFTIKNEPIASIDLMERAAGKCVDWMAKKFDKSDHFLIICGKGNNGGDGLAIARLLYNLEYQVNCFIIETKSKGSEDFENNLERLKSLEIPIRSINSASDFHIDISKNNIIIDAILGTGLKGAVRGLSKVIIDKINQATYKVISIDIPSGLVSEPLSDIEIGSVIEADYTLTFECPKLSFLLPATGNYVGSLQILPIGLANDFINSSHSNYYYIEESDIKKLLKKRAKFSHKGTFGNALIVAGSYGKIGAAILSGKACMRAGVGKLTIHSPKCANSIIQTALPEAMVSDNEGKKYLVKDVSIKNYDAIGVGPGIGTNPKTIKFLKNLILTTQGKNVVLDADALNIVSKDESFLEIVPKNCVLTPHLKEFERLVDTSKNDLERVQKLQSFAKKHTCYIVLKGAYTAIASPNGNIFFNSTGNSGMATAGSGDVLTGIITSLLAQGYSAKESCLLGVYIHGKAGDVAAKKIGKESIIASDIIENLGKVFLTISTTELK